METENQDTQNEHQTENEIAIFGGGCFWCTEAVFKRLKGVTRVAPGYAGGETDHPTYEEVCSGATGHAEVIEVEYHPEQISYTDLLTVFFAVHDPTTLNRQGSDVGTQYRSIILTTSDEQDEQARAMITELQTAYDDPIVTELAPLDTFYEAEGYHHDYFEKNPSQVYCQLVVRPKVEKFEKRFKELIADSE